MAFEGFQLITNAVTKTRDPQRNIPRGIYGSIGIVTVLYVLIALVAVGNLDQAGIHAAEEYALAAVAQPVLGTLGVVMVDIAAMLATASAINATIFGASRIAYEMGNDKLAPRPFARLTRSRIPAAGMIAIVALSLLLSVFGGLELIASFSSLTFLLVSLGVCVANYKLKDQTHTAQVPVLLGMVLITITITLLIFYLAVHSTGILYFCIGTYAAIAAAFAAFRHSNHRPR